MSKEVKGMEKIFEGIQKSDLVLVIISPTV